MRQLVSLSRNESLVWDEKENKLVPLCELIIAYTDGKEYQMGDMEPARRTKISEARITLTPDAIQEMIDYLKSRKADLEDLITKVRDPK